MSRCEPDCVVLDLEDGTPPAAKDEGRAVVAAALHEVDFGGAETIVRINAMDTALAARDIEWLRSLDHFPDAVMLPKVDSAADLAKFEELLGRNGVPLWILPTETAVGYRNLDESCQYPSVTAVIWAAEDFAADIGANGSREPGGRLREVFRVARSNTLLAAKAAGISAIDTTYVDLKDLEGLRREALECSGMGFDGKAAIHPSHVTVINSIFQPDDASIEHAERLVEAFDSAGGGAISFGGRMVDAPHYKQARRLLARAGR